MRVRRSAATTISAVCLAALAACTGGAKPVVSTSPLASGSASPSDTSPVPASPTPSVSATTPAPVPPALHSLTGLPGTAGKPVIAVKIDNTPPGRPQYGLNAADIVYVEQVEGAATRLMAVFQSTLPTRVGPNRSGRESDLEILAAYGKVGFAFSGAQPRVLTLIRNAPVVSADEDNGSFFFRDNSRYAPYNLYLNVAQLLRQRPQIATVKDNGLHFAATPAPGGTPATAVTVPMSRDETIGFTYDPAGKRWLESQGGRAIFVAGGSRVWTTNVLIQEVTVVPSRFHDILGNNTPFSHSVGAGNFRVLRPDGTTATGTWYRHTKSSPTTYTLTGGTPLTIVPGRTWICLMPKGNHVTVK
jgi:hypothetical protein